MVNGKNIRKQIPQRLRTDTAEKRLLRRFIKEKNLLETFNRFRRIAGIKTKEFTVKQDEQSHRLVAFRKGDKTIVLDAFSLRVMATTKRFNLQSIERGSQQTKARKTRFGKKIFIQNQVVVKLREIARTPLTNVIAVDRTTWLAKKLGKLFISVTFTGEKGEKFVAEGGSRQLRLLNFQQERTKAFNEAFRGALGQVPFSYKDFIINWIHYSYFIQKKRPQPIFQHGAAIRAV